MCRLVNVIGLEYITMIKEANKTDNGGEKMCQVKIVTVVWSITGGS